MDKNNLLQELEICEKSLRFWRSELDKTSSVFNDVVKGKIAGENKKQTLRKIDYLIFRIDYEDKILNKIEQKYKNLL